ncbi:MAG: metallophosphoesterase [Spirochaetales bacterium]|nr:metallophosphoesterase [Spirochaetales bacterium]
MMNPRKTLPALIALLFSVLWGVMVSAEGRQDSVRERQTIAVITDPHYLSPSLFDEGPLFDRVVYGGDGKNLYIQDQLLAALSDDLVRHDIDALLVTGDITLNGERQSHKDFAARLKTIENRGIDVFVIPGNHDLNNPKARGFTDEQVRPVQSLTPGQFLSVYRNYGFSEALSRDKDSLSYLVELNPDVRLLMLDSNQYDMNLSMGYSDPGGLFKPSTLQWIQDVAEEAVEEGAVLFAALHHSLIDHHSMLTRGFTIDNNKALLSRFKTYGIEAALTGHIHVQDIVSDENGEGLIYDIAGGAFTVYPHTYGVLELGEESWSYETREVDVPSWAAQNDPENTDLLDFEHYSSGFFRDFSHRMVEKQLEGSDYSSDDIASISEIAGILNLNFFAGLEEKNTPSLEGYDLESLLGDSESFMLMYLQSITEDSGPDDNYLEKKYNIQY